jgi:hypothetical protein
VVTPKHKAPRRLAVEAVRQGWFARQAEPKGVEIVLEACPAFRAAMDGDAGGFVDHQHETVAIEKSRSCFFGRHDPKASRAALLRKAEPIDA